MGVRIPLDVPGMENKIKKVKEFFAEKHPLISVYHGIAIVKNDIAHIKKGDIGIITAYLPEMEKFAVIFEKHGWITFSDPEEWFLNNFEVVKK